MIPSVEPSFQRLIDRSITAWRIIFFVSKVVKHEEALDFRARDLRSRPSIENVLRSREYWFFQRRECFLRQKHFLKFDLRRLDEYVLLPIDYGWVNMNDCYFVSHYWRTAAHPDPDGVDLRQVQADLAPDALWSYIWVDWTCMPQGGPRGAGAERTPVEKHYFRLMLQCIPMLVRDCAFTWRFPNWEPRAWVLYELAEYLIMHTLRPVADDNQRFAEHVDEMVVDGVRPVLQRYGYRCTNASDLTLVTGWLELLVILKRIIPDSVAVRQDLMDHLNRPANGSLSEPLMDLEISKAEGTVRYKGKVHHFNSNVLYHFQRGKGTRGRGGSRSEYEFGSEQRRSRWPCLD